MSEPPAIVGGRYRVQDELGRGAYGAVYRARDQQLDRTVALKLFAPQADRADQALRRFDREARTVAQVQAPQVVPLLDHGVLDDGRPYLVFEFIDGTDLRRWVRDLGQPARRQVLAWTEDLLAALAACHGAGVLHRDVKPENLLVRPDGSLALADFGLALPEDLGTRLTRTGTVVGTAIYLAPEVLRGEAPGPPADLFAAAAIVYELLYGKFWRKGADMDALVAELRAGHPPLGQEPRLGKDAELDPWLHRGLDPEPSRRFASAEAMLADLRARLGDPQRTQASARLGAAALAGAPGGPEAPARGGPRALVGALVLVAGLAAGVAFSPGPPPGETAEGVPGATRAVGAPPVPWEALEDARQRLGAGCEEFRPSLPAARRAEVLAGCLDPAVPLRLRRYLRACREVAEAGGAGADRARWNEAAVELLEGLLRRLDRLDGALEAMSLADIGTPEGARAVEDLQRSRDQLAELRRVATEALPEERGPPRPGRVDPVLLHDVMVARLARSPTLGDLVRRLVLEMAAADDPAALAEAVPVLENCFHPMHRAVVPARQQEENAARLAAWARDQPPARWRDPAWAASLTGPLRALAWTLMRGDVPDPGILLGPGQQLVDRVREFMDPAGARAVLEGVVEILARDGDPATRVAIGAEVRALHAQVMRVLGELP